LQAVIDKVLLPPPGVKNKIFVQHKAVSCGKIRVYQKGGNMRIYLDESICEALGFAYYGTVKKNPVFAHVGKVLTLRSEWDEKHRFAFAGFVTAGVWNMKLENTGLGWFRVLNYPQHY